MNFKKIDFNKRYKSFGYAFTGIKDLLKSETNARIHFLATIIALFTGYILHISKLEWCAILIVIALVWAMEAVNTVVENVIDHLFPEYHETARITKDIAAGAVLISAIIALACGLIIFLPKLL